MYSKYISTLILDYRKLAYKSFLDKHGSSAVALAKKMSERQKHEQTIDSQTRGIRYTDIEKVKLRRHLKTMNSGLNYMEDIWYEIYEKALTKKRG